MAFRLSMTLFFAIVAINLHIMPGLANANPAEKGLMLLCGLVFLATRRINWVNLIIVGVLALAAFIAALSTQYSGFSFNRFVRALVSFVAPWLLLAAEPTTSDRDHLLRTLGWMPIVMVGIGAIYDAAGLSPLWHTDFLGAPRLQGSTMPSGLGTIGMLGVVACAIGFAVHGRLTFVSLGAVDFLILILSAARMSLALTLLVCAAVYFAMVRKSAGTLVLTIVFGIVTAAGVLLTIGQPLLTRFESESLSGRSLIWEYLGTWLDKYPAFGVGLGHQILLLPEHVMQQTGTMAAHNEYLRLAVETGYFGAVLIFGGLVLLCLNLWASLRVNFQFAFLAACIAFFIYCRTDNAISSSFTPFLLVLASFAFARRDYFAIDAQPSRRAGRWTEAPQPS